jgi:hypothetical protein
MVAGAGANAAKKTFWQIWYKHEIIPIYLTVGAGKITKTENVLTYTNCFS